MCEKRFELRQNSDGAWWLFNNETDRCLMISKNFASLLDISIVLNQLSDSNEGLILDRNRQEEKLDIARRNLSKQLEKINEQQAEIERLKEQLSLVCKAESSSPYNSVKEVLRREIFGLDCVAQESANAWNHYCVLSKLFEEQYGEHWDNFD